MGRALLPRPCVSDIDQDGGVTMRIVSASYLIPTQPRTDRHRLAGTVTVDGSPASKRVLVVNRVSLEVLAATISDQVSGAWELAGLAEHAEGSLLVLAFDDSGQYNAEVTDYVSQGQGIFLIN